MIFVFVSRSKKSMTSSIDGVECDLAFQEGIKDEYMVLHNIALRGVLGLNCLCHGWSLYISGDLNGGMRWMLNFGREIIYVAKELFVA